MNDDIDSQSLEQLETIIRSGDEHFLALARLLNTSDARTVKAAMLRRGISATMIEAFADFNAGKTSFTQMRARCLEQML
jgi:hypothetical protein